MCIYYFLDLSCRNCYIFGMQVTNPLVPTPVGSGSVAPAPVANAPNVPDSTQYETSKPVTPSKDTDRTADSGSKEGHQVDITA